MKPEPNPWVESVRTVALAAGFDDCRFAAITGPAPHAAEFASWLEDGRHGTMDWLARHPHRRMDPREVLPGAASVISLALNYYQEVPATADPPLPSASPPPVCGKIARYAWGDDYHTLLGQKLEDLNHHLESLGGVQRYYADTGPVLERDWATAAGLGWNGKSTVQIHPALGCYTFLAEILTTLILPPDPPMADHCGKCTRCITACPTQAITSPHQLDARKCLSYLTIEHKGSIPMEFRRAMGNRIYGCDDCLAACPWNRFARASREISLAPRPYVHQWPLREFLSLSAEGFTQLFRLSPIRRIKRPAFLRNVCVALGNSGAAGDLPALERAALDPDPLIQEHALWAIGEIRRRENWEREENLPFP